MTGLGARFWAKVDKTDYCWIWTRCVNSKGYGCFAVHGRSQLAHRLTYEDAVGPISAGLTIDHVVCQNHRCVNPAHLEVVTRVENLRRKAALITACRVGHPLTLKPGDRQRRCRPCEADQKRERRKVLVTTG